MLKKFRVLVLIVLVVVMSACSSGITVAPANEQVEEVTRVLRVLGEARSYPGEEDAWNEAIAEFEKTCNCKVETNFEGAWADIPQRLQTAAIAKEQVDIVTSGASLINTTLARSGTLLDLTDLIEPLLPRITQGLEAYTIGGHVWGIPFYQISTTTFYYNKDIFDNLGIEEPTTYEEMLAISKTIQNEMGIHAVLHQGITSVYWPMWFFEVYAQTSGNKSVENVIEFLKGNRTFTNSEEIAAFDLLANFSKDEILARESLDTDHDGMFAAFAQGKVAMILGGTWELAPLKDAVGDAFTIGVFGFPKVVTEPSVTPKHGGGPGRGLSIASFSDPENLDLALSFIEFLTRPEWANKIISAQRPYYASIVGVESVDDPLAIDLVQKVYPNNIAFLDWIWPAEVNDAVKDGVAGVLAGVMSSEEAAQSVQDAFDKLVQEQNFSYDWWTKWTESDWEKVTPKSFPEIKLAN